MQAPKCEMPTLYHHCTCVMQCQHQRAPRFVNNICLISSVAKWRQKENVNKLGHNWMKVVNKGNLITCRIVSRAFLLCWGPLFAVEWKNVEKIANYVDIRDSVLVQRKQCCIIYATVEVFFITRPLHSLPLVSGFLLRWSHEPFDVGRRVTVVQAQYLSVIISCVVRTIVRSLKSRPKVHRWVFYFPFIGFPRCFSQS